MIYPLLHCFVVMVRTVACLLYEIKATIHGMLTSSFIFLPGVGPVTERRWWEAACSIGEAFWIGRRPLPATQVPGTMKRSEKRNR
jgi:hypothetical protein